MGFSKAWPYFLENLIPSIVWTIWPEVYIFFSLLQPILDQQVILPKKQWKKNIISFKKDIIIELFFHLYILNVMEKLF